MRAQSYQVALPLIADADAEARRFGHDYLGPEHLLLALAGNASGASQALFDRYRMSPESLRDSVSQILGPAAKPQQTGEPLRIALRAHVALAHAITAASRRGDRSLAYTADELLAALLAEDVAADSIIEAVFSRAGLSPAKARLELSS